MNRVTTFNDRYGRVTVIHVHTPQEDHDARTRPSTPDELDALDALDDAAASTGRRSQRVTDETVQEIITRYQGGFTVPTIAAALNLSPDTIKRYLRHARVPLRDDRKGQGPTRTADRIARAGTTTRTIRAWAREQGIPVPLAGQVPDAIIDAYLAAQTPDRSSDQP
jgi:hypothetical protein